MSSELTQQLKTKLGSTLQDMQRIAKEQANLEKGAKSLSKENRKAIRDLRRSYQDAHKEAVQLERGIKKTTVAQQRQGQVMRQTRQEAASTHSTMATGLRTIGGYFAGMLSTAQLITGVFNEWNGALDRAAKRAGVILDAVREMAGGAGNLLDLPELRRFVAQRDGMVSQEQDLAAMSGFKSTAQNAGIESIKQAVGQSEQAFYAFGAGNNDTFNKTLGGLVEAGIDQSAAGDIAGMMVQAGGGKASTASDMLVRGLRQVGNEYVDDLVVLSLAGAQGNQSPEALIGLLKEWDKAGRKGSPLQWAQTANLNQVSGETKPRLAALRRALPGAAGARNYTGFLGREFHRAAPSAQDLQRRRIARLKRQRQTVASTPGALAGATNREQYIAERNLELDQQGMLSGYDDLTWGRALDPTTGGLIGWAIEGAFDSGMNNLRRAGRGLAGDGYLGMEYDVINVRIVDDKSSGRGAAGSE